MCKKGCTGDEEVLEVTVPSLLQHKAAESRIANSWACKGDAADTWLGSIRELVQELKCAQLCNRAAQAVACRKNGGASLGKRAATFPTWSPLFLRGLLPR